jgi:Secretion system C-terminal sorting domain
VQNEQEVEYYEVERSKDGAFFEPVKRVKSLNNPTSVYPVEDDVSNYSFDVVYYRIKQVNKSGEVFYSRIISFKNGGKGTVKIKAYPNPVHESLVLDIICLAKENTSATIFDAAGKAVMQKSFALEKGENAIRFSNIRKLAKGGYTIVVIVEGMPYTVRIIKE